MRACGRMGLCFEEVQLCCVRGIWCCCVLRWCHVWCAFVCVRVFRVGLCTCGHRCLFVQGRLRVVRFTCSLVSRMWFLVFACVFAFVCARVRKFLGLGVSLVGNVHGVRKNNDTSNNTYRHTHIRMRNATLILAPLVLPIFRQVTEVFAPMAGSTSASSWRRTASQCAHLAQNWGLGRNLGGARFSCCDVHFLGFKCVANAYFVTRFFAWDLASLQDSVFRGALCTFELFVILNFSKIASFRVWRPRPVSRAKQHHDLATGILTDCILPQSVHDHACQRRCGKDL